MIWDLEKNVKQMRESNVHLSHSLSIIEEEEEENIFWGPDKTYICVAVA
jgi:hypothetical protein